MGTLALTSALEKKSTIRVLTSNYSSKFTAKLVLFTAFNLPDISY